MGNFKYVKHEGTNKKEASSTLYLICSSVKLFQKDNLKNVFLLMFQSSLNSLFTRWGKMFYRSPLFAFLQILKLSVFAYIDHYTVLVKARIKKREIHLLALVSLSGSTQVLSCTWKQQQQKIVAKKRTVEILWLPLTPGSHIFFLTKR